MPDSISSPAFRAAGLIPHFWFDAIGRVIPGAFAVVGAMSVWSGDCFDEISRCCPTALVETADFLTTASTTVQILTFFLFLGSAYFAGLLIGAVSQVVEVLWRWIAWDALNQRLRAGDVPQNVTTLLRDRFVWQLGSVDQVAQQTLRWFRQRRAQVRLHLQIVHASELCTPMIWNASDRLGVIMSRWDAEALAARSILATSLCLLAWTLKSDFLWRSFLFSAIAVAAFFNYAHYRQRQRVGRFTMLASVAPGREASSLRPPVSEGL